MNGVQLQCLGKLIYLLLFLAAETSFSVYINIPSKCGEVQYL